MRTMHIFLRTATLVVIELRVHYESKDLLSLRKLHLIFIKTSRYSAIIQRNIQANGLLILSLIFQGARQVICRFVSVPYTRNYIWLRRANLTL